MHSKMIATIALALSAWLALAAPSAWADDSLKHIIDQKTLTVGVALNPPWILKKADGKFAGYDVDLTSALASDLGVDLKLVEVPWNDLKARLLKGDFDMIAAGYASTPERAREVVFSDQTGAADIRMVATIASLGKKPGKAVAAPGYKIAVLSNSTDEAAAKEAFPRRPSSPSTIHQMFSPRSSAARHRRWSPHRQRRRWPPGSMMRS